MRMAAVGRVLMRSFCCAACGGRCNTTVTLTFPQRRDATTCSADVSQQPGACLQIQGTRGSYKVFWGVQLYCHCWFSFPRVSKDHIAVIFRTNVPVGNQDVDFEVISVLDIKIAVFWAVMACKLQIRTGVSEEPVA